MMPPSPAAAPSAGSAAMWSPTSPQAKQVDCFDFVIFGGTGDLSMRKLLPALFLRDQAGQLPPDARIIGVSRSPLDAGAFRAMATEQALPYLSPAPDPAAWTAFLDRLDHRRVDALSEDGWASLAECLSPAPERVRAFYLATAPGLFGVICQRLQQAGLVTPQSRVVLEKPLGHDLASARAINAAVGSVFAEHQIFRIDHYLGKETVQNLLALRFANSLFEPLWSARFIDHVQISVAETVGVEKRGEFYDQTGALRDMVQNHLLQLLCLVAMEPPSHMTQDAVRDEKLKILRALRPITATETATHTVRGQYRAGAIQGQSVDGYPEDLGHTSDMETFVAVKAEVCNWRWAGVPFYLRTGKRLARRTSEIIIQFRPPPHRIFPMESGLIQPNRLVVRLQPDEGITLHLMGKDPGPGGLRLRAAPLNLSFAETYGTRYPDAYERLLLDVVRGNSTLFMRRDEVEAAWQWAEPILAGWASTHQAVRPYAAGTWGPSAAIALIERDGRTWDDDGLSA